MWDSADGSLVSDLKVTVLDILVLVAGLVIPIFLFAVVVIVVAMPLMS